MRVEYPGAIYRGIGANRSCSMKRFFPRPASPRSARLASFWSSVGCGAPTAAAWNPAAVGAGADVLLPTGALRLGFRPSRAPLWLRLRGPFPLATPGAVSVFLAALILENSLGPVAMLTELQPLAQRRAVHPGGLQLWAGETRGPTFIRFMQRAVGTTKARFRRHCRPWSGLRNRTAPLCEIRV